jgi:hypothetical protein
VEVVYLDIDLGRSECWVAFAVTGVMSIPVFGLGLGPDMYLLPLRKDSVGKFKEIHDAVEASFQSFGITDHKPLTLGTMKVILIPMLDVTSYGVKVGLMVADMALSVFNKKAFGAKASLINWHRNNGKAVGVVIRSGELTPIQPTGKAVGSAILAYPGPDMWDAFLNEALTDRLSELGVALRKCMEWEREAQQTAHVTHRFAFLWIGLEAMLPAAERSGPGAGKRFPILTGSPAAYYSRKLLKDQSERERLAEYINPEANRWRTAIDEMYSCRCEILHEGGTDLTSGTIDPLKVDWYGLLSQTLCTRIIGLAINAFEENVGSVEGFWESYIPEFLYSEKNHWHKSGVFFQNFYLNHDWQSGPYTDPLA